ncbi:MAG: hypothetical protein U0R78_17475 [Nocardioidaceae bacterium]
MTREVDALSRQNLLRLGFRDPSRARDELDRLDDAAEPLLAILARTADPDQALTGPLRPADAARTATGLDPTPSSTTRARPCGPSVRWARARLSPTISCATPSSGTNCGTRPRRHFRLAAYSQFRGAFAAVGATPGILASTASLGALGPMRSSGVPAAPARLAPRDLAHHLGVDDAAGEPRRPGGRHARRRPGDRPRARGADRVVGAAGGYRDGQGGGHEPQLRLRRRRHLRGPSRPRGPEETPALKVATRLAAALMQVCSDQTSEGTIWPVDAALRPEGKAGPLVRTLASHRGYYERWAKTWEFQALL